MVVSLVTVVICLGGAVVIGGVVSGQWKLETIRTGSMSPAMPTGSEAIVMPEPVSSVSPGQIIVFKPPGEGGTTVAHRVQSVTDTLGAVAIVTKGDANPAPDQWKAVLMGARAWRVRMVVPWIGYVYSFVTIPIVRLGVLVLIVAAVLGMLLPRLVAPRHAIGSEIEAGV
ncbi:MAG: signal peptidase I [Acidimicrobiales bacterium]